MSMEKACNRCSNLEYDAQRAHYKCRVSGRVVYNSDTETCDDWNKYVPIVRTIEKGEEKLMLKTDTKN